MAKANAFLAAAVLLLCVHAACALYEDELGQINWTRETVGVVSEMHPFRSGSGVLTISKGSFTAPAVPAVLARVSTNTGRAVWRNTLDTRVVVGSFCDASALATISLTRSGKLIASRWRKNDGSLVWEESLPVKLGGGREEVQCSMAALHRTPKTTDLLVALGGTALLLSLDTGATTATLALPSDWAEARLVSGPDQQLWLVKGAVGTRVAMAAVAVSEHPTQRGALQITFNENPVVQGGFLVAAPIATQERLVALTGENGVPSRIEIADLSLARPSFSSQPLKDLIKGAPSSATLYTVGAGAVVVAAQGAHHLLTLAGAQLVLAESFVDTPEKKYRVPEGGAPDQPAVLLSFEPSQSTCDIVSLSTGKPRHVHSFPTSGDFPFTLSFHEFRRRSGSHDFFAVCVGADKSLVGVSSQSDGWVRHDFTALTSKIVFMHLPANRTLATTLGSEFEAAVSDNLAAQFVNRLAIQLRRLTIWLQWLSRTVTDMDTWHNLIGVALDPLADLPKRSDRTLSKDRFGFQQVAVGATSNRVLYTVHTLDGHMLWHRHLPAAIVDISPSRAHSGLPPLVLVVLQEEASVTALWLDGLTGQEVRRLSRPGRFAHLMSPEGAVDSGAHERVHFMIMEDLTVHVLPPQASEAVHSRTGPLHTFVLDTASNTVRGFKLTHQGTLQPLWSFAAPTGERVVLMQQPAREAKNAPFRILGDSHTVHPKYINNNMFVVVTLSLSDASRKATLDSTLHVYGLDAVSGVSLFHHYAEGAHEPVHVAFSDNNIYLHYFSAMASRHVLTTIELDTNLLHMEGSYPTEKKYTEENISATSRTFYLPFGVSCMGVTSTEQGVTARNLLIGDNQGRLLELNHRLVDARRVLPSEPETSADRAAGILPFDPVLHPPPTAYLSHNTTIPGIRQIVSTPSALESTSLVLAVGLDLFFIRCTPSNTFDMLSNDFNKAMLVGTVGGLLALTAVSAIFRRRALEKWA